MSTNLQKTALLDPASESFYLRALASMQDSDVPFLVGGAYALAYFTGVARHTKDLDLFVRPTDADRALAVLAAAGCRTEKTFPHWLGKAFWGDDFIDVIHSSGNGLCVVDDEWFADSVSGRVFGMDVALCPAEEIIWQKSFVMERERFDGADILHLIRAHGSRLDWDRLVRRYGPNWRVLLSLLIIFGFVYPSERSKVPQSVLEGFVRQLSEDRPETPEKVCRGTLLSRTQYLIDTEKWNYADPRLRPHGTMSYEDIVHWTAAAFETR